MSSEDLVRQAMVVFGAMEQNQREQILEALVAVKVSREVKGANLVMDPKFAEMLSPVLSDPEARDAAIEALVRLDKNKRQRESEPKGARPTELSVVLFASSAKQLSEGDGGRYIHESLGAKYGTPAPEVRDSQFVVIPDLDASLSLTVDVAQTYYSRLVELPGGRDFGAPNDSYSGKVRDGTPVAALFFWHRSEGGKKTKKKLFGRG